jgi:hypothetical protein
MHTHGTRRRSWECRDILAPEFLGTGFNLNDPWDYRHILDSPEDIPWRAPVALFPPSRSARLQAQSAYFTIHGSDNRPLEEQFKNVTGGLHCRIMIPSSSMLSLRETLDFVGINEHLMYPDLDGLARHLHRKFGLF